MLSLLRNIKVIYHECIKEDEQSLEMSLNVVKRCGLDLENVI